MPQSQVQEKARRLISLADAIVADIQRASTHDGPGIRTTVFFKGCPLSCRWCHNPECISPEPELLFYPEKCIGCKMCDKGCFSGARVMCGKKMSSKEVLAQVLADKAYYGKDGGVTFSGGEPLYQRQALSDCIDECKKHGIHCAIETALAIYDEEIFKKLDLVMADFKIWDSDIHEKYTGVPNEKIIENFLALDTLNVPIIVRTPVIPEIEQGIDKISDFTKKLKNVICYELLPYHPLGNTKRQALCIEKDEFTVPKAQYMEELKKYAYCNK